MANPVGRPRTTIDDLPEDWEQIMVEIAQEGGSKVECMANLGINRGAWGTLCEDSREFLTTVERCDILCQNWWEKQGRRMTSDGQGSSVVWKFNMQNRFGWRERTENSNQEADKNLPKSIDDFYATQGDE